MPDKIHTYLKNENKCKNCKFFNTKQNVKKHINSTRNINGELCLKYQTEYSKWFYLKIR